MITYDEVAAVLTYDAQTGVFRWNERIAKVGEDRAKVAAWNTRYAGKVAGVKTHGYIRISVNDQKFYAHRLAWLLTHAEWPKGVIDHIDCNGENNRINNLRDVTKVENARNPRKPRSNKSGYTGVTMGSSGSFYAGYHSKGRRIHIGTFETAEEAAEAYRAAVL